MALDGSYPSSSPTRLCTVAPRASVVPRSCSSLPLASWPICRFRCGVPIPPTLCDGSGTDQREGVTVQDDGARAVESVGPARSEEASRGATPSIEIACVSGEDGLCYERPTRWRAVWSGVLPAARSHMAARFTQITPPSSPPPNYATENYLRPCTGRARDTGSNERRLRYALGGIHRRDGASLDSTRRFVNMTKGPLLLAPRGTGRQP